MTGRIIAIVPLNKYRLIQLDMYLYNNLYYIKICSI